MRHSAAQAADSTPCLTAEEAREFADVLGIQSDSVTSDDGSKSYDELVADPLKSLMAQPTFFARIKVDVLLEQVSKYLPSASRRPMRVLDIGCGTGDLMRQLQPHFGEVHGCDPSAAMVRRAGSRAVQMTSRLRLPFEDNVFDIAVCACVYHHILPDLRPSHLAEIRRVLSNSGILVIFEHNPHNPLTRRIVNRCPIDATADLLTSDAMAELMLRGGYGDVSSRHYLFFPEFLYARLGWLERYLNWTSVGGQYCTVGRGSAQ